MARITKICLVVGVFGFLSQSGCLAQEPALFRNSPAIRYEQAPGYFHYVFACTQATSDTVQPLPKNEPALCWNVQAVRLHMTDGKIDDKPDPPPVIGVLKISKLLVSFIPNELNEAHPVQSFVRTDVVFKHESRRVAAVLGTAAQFYEFGLMNVCVRCVAGSSPLDTTKGAQLDAEFAQIDDCLKDFEGALARYRELALPIRFGVTPENQPGPSATAESLRKYGELNVGLAEMCPEPARSCIQTYAKYQSCSASAAPNSCGAAPTCSAFCAVVPAVYDKLNPAVILSPMAEMKDYALLSPLQPGDVKVLRDSAGPPGVVGEVYRGRIIKMAGPTAGGASAVRSGVMAGQIVTRVDPVYPAVARAAHITGTVLLHAIIGKDGRVEQLEAISGPPMLQGAALDAVKHWTYKPYLLNGQPTEVDTTVLVNFNLSNPSATLPGQQ